MTFGWLVCLFRGHRYRKSLISPSLVWCKRCKDVRLDTGQIER